MMVKVGVGLLGVRHSTTSAYVNNLNVEVDTLVGSSQPRNKPVFRPF